MEILLDELNGDMDTSQQFKGTLFLFLSVEGIPFEDLDVGPGQLVETHQGTEQHGHIVRLTGDQGKDLDPEQDELFIEGIDMAGLLVETLFVVGEGGKIETGLPHFGGGGGNGGNGRVGLIH